MNVLLIDDDHGISSALKQALAGSYALDIAADGATGLDRARSGKYQLIVLDLGLPDMPGLEVCQQLRSEGLTAPILVLSGDTAILHKINLLDAGANDYLTKPFSLGELKARLRVLGRQVGNDQPLPQFLCVDDIILDSQTHQVRRAGMLIALRRKEFAMLECLMQNAGTVVTRQALMHYAWQAYQDPWTNTIDVHIKYLRDKVDRPFARPLIKTVHGLGYKLEAPRGVANTKTNKGVNNERPITGSAD